MRMHVWGVKWVHQQYTLFPLYMPPSNKRHIWDGKSEVNTA